MTQQGTSSRGRELVLGNSEVSVLNLAHLPPLGRQVQPKTAAGS